MVIKLLIYILAGVALYRFFWAPAKEGLEEGRGKSGSARSAKRNTIKKPRRPDASEAREKFSDNEGDFIDYEEVD